MLSLLGRPHESNSSSLIVQSRFSLVQHQSMGKKKNNRAKKKTTTKSGGKDASNISVSGEDVVSIIDKLSLAIGGAADRICECKQSVDNNLCTYCTEIFQPPKAEEECPICCLPVKIDGRGGLYLLCCGKSICMGCLFEEENTDTDISLGSVGGFEGLVGRRMHPAKCPFCRALSYVSDVSNVLFSANSTERSILISLFILSSPRMKRDYKNVLMRTIMEPTSILQLNYL